MVGIDVFAILLGGGLILAGLALALAAWLFKRNGSPLLNLAGFVAAAAGSLVIVPSSAFWMPFSLTDPLIKLAPAAFAIAVFLGALILGVTRILKRQSRLAWGSVTLGLVLAYAGAAGVQRLTLPYLPG